jgi:predicted phage tail protein
MTKPSQLILTGSGKSGKKQRAPVDHAATLFSRATAQIIDLLCEGEINGLVNGSKSIFFDEVRVQNDDDSFNFEGVVIEEKVGTPTQAAAKGFDQVESTVAINQEVTDISSPQFTITESSIDAIRVIIQLPSLMIQNTENGDLLPHTVGIKIEVSENHAGGAFTEVLTNEITGKTKSAYQRAYRIDLSSYTTDAPSDYPLIFKVSRTTPESETTTTQDQIFVDSYIEIQEQKFQYPDSAYVALSVDSELFGGKIPKRSYEIEGLKIQHPSNYDPDTRVYTGVWDGTFTEGYCNNPAWVMYDMLTNSRYGLGDDIDASQVDKASLYQIGKYCDELVDDGKGGKEPRFTLNAVITQRKEAYTVINAIASVFRGMAFWSAGGVSFSNDQPKDPSRVVTNANVKDGDFTYSGIGLKARHSAVLVTWNDPLDFYKQQIEVVEDPALIQRFGWRQIELVAFGTTSRAQAIRMGKWLLQAEATETETVTYEAGWDHADTTPGQIIQISDEHRVGARVAGRIMGKSLHALTTSIPTDAIAKETTFTSVTTYADTGVESDADAVFKCTIKIPSAIVPEGLIFEVGDSTTGAYVGFNGDGDLVFRAGDASATPPAAATSARIVIPYASLAKDQDLDILWDYRISPGRIRVWINNQYVAEQCTSAGADLLGSVWASTGGGGYGTLNGTTVVGESGSFSQDVQDSGVILKSTLEYWQDTDVFTPTQPHTIKESFSDGDTITSVTDTTAGGMDRNTNAVISCAIKTPAAGTTPVGIIAELGEGTLASDEAFYLGFDGTGDLVVHAGAGGASPDTAEAARIVVPASEWTADTWYHLTVQLLPATGEVGLWINHTFREWAQTSDLGPFQNGQWADADGGAYGALNGATLSTSDLTGNFNAAFNGTLTSTLDYYRDVELIESENAFDAGTLTLDQTWTTEPGDSIVVVVADNAPDTIPLVPGTSGTSVTLRSRTRKDVLLNAVFFIQGAVGAQEWTVLNNREADTHQYQITALRFDRTKFDRVEEGIIIEPERTSLLPTGTLLPPTNLEFDESLYVANGSVHTRINLSWSPAKDARVMLYQVEALSPSGNREMIALTAIPNITIQPAEEGIWSFWVSSTSDALAATHIVSTAELLNQTVIGKAAPPADVANFTSSRGFRTITLTWEEVNDLDLSYYEIRTGSDWDNGTVVVTNLVSTSFVVNVDTTADVTYSIKARDTVGNYSANATALTTAVQTIPAVTSLLAYQREHNIRITWAPVQDVVNIHYEIRHSKSGESWETSRLFERVATPYLEVPFSVTASTTEVIRVKPFVELPEGDRFYGPETTVSHTQQPVINGYRVKSRTLETAWAELGADIAARFVAHGPAVDDTYTSGATIRSITNWFEGYSGQKRIDAIDDGAWRVTINVSGGTPEGNILGVGGESTWGAMTLGFDGEGDLIWRVGNGRAQWFQYDTTGLNQYWELTETSGTRASQNVTSNEPVAGTNDLTETGTVGEGILAGSGTFGQVPTSLFESSTPSYLAGADISIAGNDWTLMFNFSINDSSDGTGKLFQLGSGNTLSVELIDGDTLRATVYDSSGAVSVDSLPLTLVADTWYFGFVLFEHSTLTLTAGIGRAYDNTGTVASGGLVDGAGSLIVGKDFDGSMCQVVWYDRLWDVATSMEIEDWEDKSLNTLTGYTRVVVPNASIPTGQDVELLFDIAKGDWQADAGESPAHARIWVDDTLYEADSSDGFGLQRLRATTSGKFAAAAGLNDGESGDYNGTLSNVTIESDLDYWNKQSVYDTLEISGDELTLVSGAEYAEYIFDFDFAGKRKGRMWVEYSAVSVATGELDIADALMEINDADFPITESFSEVDPQVAVLIQLDGAGDYVPFEEGTYEFTTSKIKITLTAGANGITKPSIENFSVYFHNDGDRISLQTQTTDATETALSTDGETATALNTVTLTDDNTMRFEGTLMARKNDNSETARYFIEGTLTRGTGAASVFMESSQLTVLHEDDEDWDVSLEAETTLGGLAVKVTGVALTTIDWIADIYVREFG